MRNWHDAVKLDCSAHLSHFCRSLGLKLPLPFGCLPIQHGLFFWCCWAHQLAGNRRGLASGIPFNEAHGYGY